MTAGSDCLVGSDDLLAWLVGDRPTAELDDLEDHLFVCDRCRRRIDSLDALRRAISEAVRSGALGGSVNAAFMDRATKEGVSIRQYRIPEGESVDCTAGPEDLVLVRLAAPLRDLEELHLDVTFEDLERDETTRLPSRDVVADRDLEEVLLTFPGEQVRAYPRSRWILHLRGESEAGPRTLGPFIMDHTPADDL